MCILKHKQYSDPSLNENMFMHNTVTVFYPGNILYALSCFIFYSPLKLNADHFPEPQLLTASIETNRHIYCPMISQEKWVHPEYTHVEALLLELSRTNIT